MGSLRRTLVVSTSLVALAAAACGESNEPAASSPTPAPVTTPAPSPPAATQPPATNAPDAPEPTAPPAATTLPPPSTTAAPPTTPAPTTTTEPGPLRITFDIYEGQVAGEDHVVVERGTEIEIVVTADLSDEVHVHGYDYKADVTPNAAAVITFVADLPGIYEVELEDAGLVIVELEVR